MYHPKKIVQHHDVAICECLRGMGKGPELHMTHCKTDNTKAPRPPVAVLFMCGMEKNNLVPLGRQWGCPPVPASMPMRTSRVRAMRRPACWARSSACSSAGAAGVCLHPLPCTLGCKHSFSVCYHKKLLCITCASPNCPQEIAKNSIVHQIFSLL